MKRFTIFSIVLISLLSSCINNEPRADVNDLQIVSGIRDRKLTLEGTEGLASEFSFRANHDWKIIDYKGFSCEPASGTKSAEGEVITVTARPLQSNNTADTICLSDLNFKMLATRFVGISAYQLPQVRMPKGSKIALDALNGSKGSTTIVSSCDDINIIVSGDITATLSAKNDKNEYIVTVTANTENTSALNQHIGTVSFEVNGEMQEGKIEVEQISAILLDRSEVLLPSKEGGKNMLTIESDFEIAVSTTSTLFDITDNGNNSFTVTAKSSNTTNNILSLGTIDISLIAAPECHTSIEVKQRKAEASQTIIVNFVGTALQYYYNHNITKIIEALDRNIQGEAQVVAITTDATNKGTLYELRYDANLGKAVQEKVSDITLTTPYNADLFESIIRKAVDFAPAKSYALVIGSHGRAWVPKVSSSGLARSLQKKGLTPETLWKRIEGAEMTRHIGDNETTRYDIEELSEAIAANNIKFDYILFDACFMSNVESLYQLRHSADYIIASPCEVMGYGFPYAKLMKYMLANGNSSYNLDKICKEYVEYYKNDATTPSGCVALTTTAELEALAKAMKEVNQVGIKSNFSLSNVQYYEGMAEHSFYDLGHMVELSCADATVAAKFKAQLDKTVTSRYHTDRFYSVYGNENVYYHDINYYSGITTSAMVEHYADDWKNTAWYKATH